MRKSKSLRIHARRRFAERFLLDVSVRELHGICKKIQQGESTFVRRTSNRVSVHDVEFEERTVRVAYDKHRKEIVTVMYPQEYKPR